jgi:molybdopterin-binding protein
MAYDIEIGQTQATVRVRRPWAVALLSILTRDARRLLDVEQHDQDIAALQAEDRVPWENVPLCG